MPPTYNMLSIPEGGVSSRYCDLVDYKDMCWTEDGGTTDTEFCACSNEDKCNSAMATITSLVTIMAAIFVSLKLLWSGCWRV